MAEVDHNIRCKNGYSIWLPPNIQDSSLVNLDIPSGDDIYTETTGKEYPFGTKLTADDRVWKYCYAGGIIDSGTQRGAGNYNMQVEGKCIDSSDIDTYTVGWRLADVDNSAVTYLTKDVYEGGYLWLMHTGRYVLYKIIKNVASDGTRVTLTLEQGLSVAVTSSTWGTAYRNIYSDCRADYPNEPTDQMAVVCVAWDGVTAARYFWGQTWGPVWITGHGGSLGNTANERQVVFKRGLMRLANSGYEYYQNAGFILTNNYYTDDALLMLQISP